MRYLTVFENEPLTIGERGLTVAEAEYLTLLSERRPGLCTRGHRSIQFAQYCGLVGLGGRMLEILPKLTESVEPSDSRGILLRLLALARDFPLFQHLPAGQDLRRSRLLEVFIAAFLHATSRIVHGGLLRQYREEEDDLHVVRGQIIASRQFASLFNRPDIIACRFDELTADNVWNQLLKSGLRAVGPWIMSVDVNRRWVELMGAFAEVDDVTFDRSIWNRLVWDRNAVRYRNAVDWVRWILGLLSPALRAGREEAPGLLFDMNALFQSAVTAAMRRGAFGSELEVHGKGNAKQLATIVGTSGRRAFTLKPDIVIQRRDEIVAIGDTKWKPLKIRDGVLVPAPEDIYQMQAYASAYACSQLALIYPWHSMLEDSVDTVFELPPTFAGTPTITIVCIDLSHEPLRAVRGLRESMLGALLSGSALTLGS